jgi:hypothetical protein
VEALVIRPHPERFTTDKQKVPGLLAGDLYLIKR